MTYNGLVCSPTAVGPGARARRLDGLILVPYMDASAVSRLGQQFLAVSSKKPLHTAQGSIIAAFGLCVQYLG